MHIEDISSRQILDSRGQPTLETTVRLETGDVGVAMVPSGASTGSHEALELRDGESSYDGKSVMKAVGNVTGPILKALKGQDVRQQETIDRLMLDLDGTMNKSSLGANAILSVSLAAIRTHAALVKTPVWKVMHSALDFGEVQPKLPKPMMNIFNGGRHADNGLRVQEFLIEPQSEDMAEGIEQGVRVYHALGKLLADRGLSTLLGDEGGFAAKVGDERAVLELVHEAIEKAGYKPGEEIAMGLDCAASEYFDTATKRYMIGPDHGLADTGILGLLEEWMKEFPIVSIEDPLAEDAWESWSMLNEKIGSRVMLIGDDLFVTSKDRVTEGISRKAANAVLIKPNQIGTLTEVAGTIRLAHQAGLSYVVSHRSGETSDDTIVDLAVASGAVMLKAGAPARGERVAKWNRLLALAETFSA